ncbi:glutamate 5-kinase [Dietzia lutea]|uniref:Glutamate 5-kinase n=2 Tax=Dietzia lutea TaxID=546160 RepID=A0A2S1R612_9ACTN|nr:glutamate 5-kinase [Dietzia lutea]AWH91727.1 glutamate 5-kinase [Dietzia lutea]
MTTERELRRRIGTARRVVVKIGSSAITSFHGGIRRDELDTLADVCQTRMTGGSDVFVVSSGAIGAGMAPLGMTTRPATLSAKQAAASVGQLELARAWGDSFARYDRVVGQVLLTAADIGRRDSAANAQRTLDRLRTLRAVPVINENDTVATNEIRFGDNDRLAALVAHLISADALILLSDVDALYDSDPRKGDATAVTMVGGEGDLDGVVAGAGGALGTGGMASKLAAARLAADAGIPVLLTSAERAAEALAAEPTVGTVFAARPERMTARRFWVRHAADARGAVLLDDGAVRAVTGSRRSLLLAGVTGVDGLFHFGDVIELHDSGGRVVARGIAQYDSIEVRSRLAERQSGTGAAGQGRPLVHADDLVAV